MFWRILWSPLEAVSELLLPDWVLEQRTYTLCKKLSFPLYVFLLIDTKSEAISGIVQIYKKAFLVNISNLVHFNPEEELRLDL